MAKDRGFLRGKDRRRGRAGLPNSITTLARVSFYSPELTHYRPASALLAETSVPGVLRSLVPACFHCDVNAMVMADVYPSSPD